MCEHVKFAKACENLPLSEDVKEKLYLRVENDGRFGLLYSVEVGPHDKMNARERAQLVQVLGKCL